ncbi:hypothetical protein OG900_33445 [Streptomyces sp. NBC_00433]
MPYRSEDLMRLVQEDHTDAVRTLEDQTSTAATGDLDGQFDSLVRSTLKAWVVSFGAAGAVATAGAVLDRIVAAVRAAVSRLLNRLDPQARHAIRDALPAAVALGVQQGVEFLRAASGRGRRVPALRVSKALADEAARVGDLIADRRYRALTLLTRGHVTRWSDLLHAIGTARSAGAAVRGHTAWTIGRAVNAGLDAVAGAAHLARLWVAEANACVRCLAYAGRLADVEGHFPGGLSWDPRSRHIGAAPIDGPPVHRWCRCRTIPWSDRWTTAGVPFPLALRREAHRSLAYGTRLATESRVARVRAARELLRTEHDLLPAVEARARTAVRTGRFEAAA